MQSAPLIQPSIKYPTVTGAYDVVATHGRMAHALRASGAGTVTVVDADNDTVDVDVKDGEMVPIQFKSISALSGGVTAVRVHVPPL